VVLRRRTYYIERAPDAWLRLFARLRVVVVVVVIVVFVVVIGGHGPPLPLAPANIYAHLKSHKERHGASINLRGALHRVITSAAKRHGRRP